MTVATPTPSSAPVPAAGFQSTPPDRHGRSFGEMVPLTLVPLSVADKASEAVREWLYTGECKDYGTGCATCDLCWEDTLQYHFLIVNQRNENRMWVGSECITHFGIRARDESGRVLGREDSAAKVRRDRRKMREDLRTRHVHQALDRLAAVDATLDAGPFKAEIGARGGLRPDRALDLMRRFKTHGIQVAPSMFRVTLRYKRDREILEAMSREDLRVIRSCLSASQRQRIDPA